jgi:DNA polymerase III delta prime subunit
MSISIINKKPNLDDLIIKKDILIKYKNLHIDSFQNIIFNGIKSSGKTTQIYALLCSIFDEKVYNLKHNSIEIEKKIFKFRSSIYHIEIDCIELLNNDRLFFNNYLKEYAATRNIGLDIPKVILITNVEKICYQTFLFLRKIIENNYKSSRFIFETSKLSCIPESIRSRFFIIRISPPKKKELFDFINKSLIDNKKKISKTIINKIINKEIYYQGYYHFFNIINGIEYYLETNEIIQNQYYNFLEDLIKIIFIKNINIIQISKIKSLLEKAFINFYDFNDIIYKIDRLLYKKLYNDNNNNDNDDLLYKISQKTIQCDYALNHCTGKYFIHLENYIIQLIILIHNLDLKEN